MEALNLQRMASKKDKDLDPRLKEAAKYQHVEDLLELHLDRADDKGGEGQVGGSLRDLGPADLLRLPAMEAGTGS